MHYLRCTTSSLHITTVVEGAMPVKNIAGAPARGPDLWGREEDIRGLWELLIRGSVLLSAPRRWGKSSLMYALLDNPWPGWRVQQLDVEFVETPSEFLTELAAALLQLDPVLGALRKAKDIPTSLLRWISTAISDVEVGALGELKLKLRESMPGDQAWPELAEQLLTQLRRLDGSLLIVLDEFPIMIGSFLERDRAGGLRFLKWFRAQRLKDNALTLRFLLGGSVNIEPLLEQFASEALLNDLERFHLHPLSTERAVTFVTEVLRGEAVSFEDGVPQEIVSTVGAGVHYFLQVLISECRAHLRQQRASTLRVTDVQKVYDLYVLGPPSRARFSHYHSRLKTYYGRLEDAARFVLGMLTRTSTCQMDQLQQALRSHNIEHAAFDELIARLESDYYITRRGSQVCFQNNFLRDWWLRNAYSTRKIP